MKYYIILLSIFGIAFVNSRSIYYTTSGFTQPSIKGIPLFISYPQQLLQVFQTKHHRPDHKGDENDKDDEDETQPQSPIELKNQLRIIPGFPITYQITAPLPPSGALALQYHSQDELGQYEYGYSNLESSKNEKHTIDGITKGSNSYIDSKGKLQIVDYISDDFGFRVAATNLPKALIKYDIPESDEVIQAKIEHFRAHQDAVHLLHQTQQEQQQKQQTDKKHDLLKTEN